MTPIHMQPPVATPARRQALAMTPDKEEPAPSPRDRLQRSPTTVRKGHLVTNLQPEADSGEDISVCWQRGTTERY